ncbi:hypothetical protein BH09PSE5_BH09PSE5_04670 [soil metagenome]
MFIWQPKVLNLLFSLLRRKPTHSRARRPSERRPSVATSGKAARGPDRARDKTLALETVRWMNSLPPSARPNELAALHPRICNHLAMIWSDQILMENYFNGLLVDTRGGRSGFSPKVGNELIRLHVFYANTKAHPHAAKAWDDRMLAVGDR